MGTKQTKVKLGGFILGKSIGKGGMGHVWEAYHPLLRISAVAKVMMIQSAKKHVYRALFRREAHALARLHHPSIEEVYDYGEISASLARQTDGALPVGAPYLILERVEGNVRPLDSWFDVAKMLVHTLQAFMHAHARGVIHRDFKPDNLLYSEIDQRWVLIDFGVAKVEDEATNEDKLVFGTASYMAPEQIRGHNYDQGPWTDLYSLGCVLFEILSGKPPFHSAKSPAAIVKAQLRKPLPKLIPRFECPEQLEIWLNALTQKDPADRPQTAAAALSGLLKIDPRIKDNDFFALSKTIIPFRAQTSASLFRVRQAPLVGRINEMITLRRVMNQVGSASQQRVLVVRGAAGVGKTRIVKQFLTEFREAGVRYAFGLRATDAPISELLGRLMRIVTRSEGLRNNVLKRRLSHWLATIAKVDDVRTYTAALERLITPHQREHGVANPPSGVVFSLLSMLARQSPVMIAIDNALAATSAWRLAEHILSEDGHSVPLLLILVVLDDDLPEKPEVETAIKRIKKHKRGNVITISRLEKTAMGELLDSLISLDIASRSSFLERAQGNPHYLVEALIQLLENNELISTPEGPFSATAVPKDLREVWYRRIQRGMKNLSSQQQLILETAAVLGHRFSSEIWKKAAQNQGLTFSENENALLLQTRLVEPTEDGFRFLHPMACAGLIAHAEAASRLAQIHYSCANALPKAEYGRRANHFLAANEKTKAIRPLLEAARISLRVGHFSEVKQRTTWLIELAKTANNQNTLNEAILIRLQALRHFSDRFDEAQQLAQQLLQAQTFAENNKKGQIYLIWAGILADHHKYERAFDFLLQAELNNKEQPFLKGQIALERGFLHRKQGYIIKASTCFQKAHDCFEAENTNTGMGSALRALAEIALTNLDLIKAADLVRLSQRASRKAGMLAEVAACENLRGEIARLEGADKMAATHYHRAISMYDGLHSTQRAYPILNLGLLTLTSGQIILARRRFEEVIVFATRMSNSRLIAIGQILLLSCTARSDSDILWRNRLQEARKQMISEKISERDCAYALETGAARIRSKFPFRALELDQFVNEIHANSEK